MSYVIVARIISMSTYVCIFLFLIVRLYELRDRSLYELCALYDCSSYKLCELYGGMLV